MSPLIISIITLASIYGILAISLGVMTGHLGIFSLAHAALFGVGAYTGANLLVAFEMNFILATIIAGLVAGSAGALMAVPALRISGEFFLVASFALQIVATSIFDNWSSVTGGTAGLRGIPRPEVLRSNSDFMLYAIAVLLVIGAFSFIIVRIPFGRMMHTIRDDESVAVALGKPIVSTKVTVTIIAGAFAGVAGVLYGQYMMYISPGSFSIATSMSVITMIVIGGMTSVPGALLGAVIITLIPEGLKQLALSPAVAGPIEQVLFGVLLVVVMFVRPQGLLGARPLKAADRYDREPPRETEAVTGGKSGPNWRTTLGSRNV